MTRSPVCIPDIPDQFSSHVPALHIDIWNMTRISGHILDLTGTVPDISGTDLEDDVTGSISENTSIVLDIVVCKSWMSEAWRGILVMFWTLYNNVRNMTRNPDHILDIVLR